MDAEAGVLRSLRSRKVPVPQEAESEQRSGEKSAATRSHRLRKTRARAPMDTLLQLSQGSCRCLDRSIKTRFHRVTKKS
eukprot:scaffold1883_cov261-Pinguiococcus_pyrenoidosus.AAC.29